MFFVVKKKSLLFTFLALFLVFGTYVGFKSISFERDTTTKTASSPQNDNIEELLPGDVIAVSSNNNYFTKAKNEKELMRSKTTELLKTIIDDESSTKEAKSDAENAIITIAYNMDLEQKIELLLQAKGFKDNIVYISEDLTTVTIKTNSLTSDDAAKINDAVTSITGNNNVKIVEVK